MNQHQLPSDIVGLAKVMPPLSRRGFMSSSAAAAAGYTLAAGPVRAEVIHTDSKGLEAGDAKVTVPGCDMPSITRGHPACNIRRSFLSAWKFWRP